MPYVENEGARIYWNEAGSGPPVLLIMGLSFSHEMWFRVVPDLTQSYRVILHDNRGVGRSDAPRGPYTIAQMARDAAAVLSAAGVSQAHVIGASMGGMIAQELALQRPELVRSLLLGCTSHGGILARWPRFIRPKGPISLSDDKRRQRELALIPLLYADSTPLERIHEDLDVRCQCALSNRGFLNQFAGILFWTSYRRLPRIQAPTLVAHGAEDRLVPPENGKVLASRIPGARFRLIPGAGHILMTDQPEVCREIVLDFLKEVSNGNGHK
ncbi:MAG: alpha/beta fold hydrolase [Acidobacteriaceae bacterium]|nr:alpha/beta fold hydrolase [Acidobacteriaceae bacterium]MBV8572076.1 alpha/beta fold hydrolase [Acidobacteriaceae bacterium]